MYVDYSLPRSQYSDLQTSNNSAGSTIRLAGELNSGVWVALADFDAADYGPEYTSLHVGDKVQKMQVPDGQYADEQWCYGRAEVHGTGCHHPACQIGI